ncbi:nucleoside recognition domain-containing protein [Achromobacter insuavis]
MRPDAIESAEAVVVLAGLENAGKSALFRGLTGQAVGDESNVAGSTVACREAALDGAAMRVVDTPGVRLRGDSAATRLALARMAPAAVVAVVMRATDAPDLMREVLAALHGAHRICVVLTFADKCDDAPALAARCGAALGVPVAIINARAPAPRELAAVRHALAGAVALPALPARPVLWHASLARRPQRTPFEHAGLGPWWALLALLSSFALPVYLAYGLSGWLQPLADAALVEPLTRVLAGAPPALQTLLVGGYGVVSLGLYSFIWAFPVVALIGLAMALTEESGLKDRMTAALDPALRHIGLSGRDLVPVLSGFGCNVVATFQSRACSACTRRACVSLIAFGSACSYQIGATLSVFGAAGRMGLFAPYLLLLFLVGAAHAAVAWRLAGRGRRAAAGQGVSAMALVARRDMAPARGGGAVPETGNAGVPADLRGGLAAGRAGRVAGAGVAAARADGRAGPAGGRGDRRGVLDPAQGWPAGVEPGPGRAAGPAGRGADVRAGVAGVDLFGLPGDAMDGRAQLGARHAWGLAGRQAVTSLVSAWLLAQALT